MLFWFVKYIAFFVFLMLWYDNYAFLKVNDTRTGENLFYYLFMFSFLPILSILLLGAPMYYSFKVKNMLYFTLITAAILIAKYGVYTGMASATNLMNGVYNGAITLIFMFIFFLRKMIDIIMLQSTR